ncbi:Similar to CEP350: Centrosome-associated protein 350 (Homo sapiens) [Cotesia congregata]|uniref:Similar to CEP350: Centrosome-associated protein 350 (Homo sapiens) n=1 Tax=Cotesia congregata TaxID=51543 RepID=A0A8J2H8S9_COTCN|nr:Similar to CEP350: Centrosome-associated protein 350 (Homo sapiens) [Cotesia congregata]
MNDNEDLTDKQKNDELLNRQEIINDKAKLAETKTSRNLYSTKQESNLIDNQLSNCRVQPYPFTFISAVKQKLAFAVQSENDNINNKLQKYLMVNEVGKMDFTKPLKIVKSLPKTSDYSNPSRESTVQRKNLSPIQSIQQEEIILNKESNKISKSSDRVSKKLDFLLSQELLNEDINLKTPDVPFQLFSRKKLEHIRDNSREKENRTKRIKKDDLNLSRESDSLVEETKRVKHSKHVSRRDVKDLIFNSSVKNDRHSTNLMKNSDPVKKSKTTNFGLSNKKDEKKARSSSLQSAKLSRDKSLEARGKTTRSESTSDRNYKLHDYITIREGSRLSNTDFQNQNSNGLLQNDDQQKYRNLLDSKQFKHQLTSKELYKKNLEKKKLSTNKLHHRPSGISVHESRSDDNELITKSDSIYTELSSQQIENKDEKITSTSNQNLTSIDEFNSINGFKKVDTTQSSDEIFLDPRKISFREHGEHGNSPQDDFCNLVTPDLNLVYRPKRKKDLRCKSFSNDDSIQGTIKQKPHSSNEKQDNVPLLHPTALHMQFQAELHLFDSYNESIRQVMDVENSLYNVKQNQERKKLQMQRLMHDTNDSSPITEKANEINNDHLMLKDDITPEENKTSVQVAEVQTQTANDIATQTETLFTRDNNQPQLLHHEIIHAPEYSSNPPKISLKTIEFDDFNQFEDISQPSKIRTMSEISLHETTSSIKTETGTEINISTRDVTCSFNKDIDLEMEQLIKDEKQMYDKIEMLFKSREKTLHDRTRKLVKLEEQKRALRDTGQDSRISSVKKKQRALLLKLQQEKDEMNRLKELHKLASQERKLMLQKQRNMFNPQMSTKNFLTKLKRSADCQSPRRLSGPMKGYNIRSNSSISSLIDSDKSQIDRSQLDEKLNISDVSVNDKINEKSFPDLETLTSSKIVDSKNNKYQKYFEESSNSSHLEISSSQKCHQMRTRKFEEKMPKSDLLCLKSYQLDLGSKLRMCQNSNNNVAVNKPVDNSPAIKSESNTLGDSSKKSKLRDKGDIIMDDDNHEVVKGLKKMDKPMILERDSLKKSLYNQDSKANSKRKNTKTLKSKSSTNILAENISKSMLNLHSSNDIVKHKRSKFEKELIPLEDKYPQPILEEISLNDSQNSFQALVKHSRVVKEKNNKLLRDIASERKAAENISAQQMIENSLIDCDSSNINIKDGDLQNLGNISTRSQVSTFTISRHSSGDSEKSYSRSVVIRSQQDHHFKTSKKLEQVLHAREAALNSRRNCVEDWIAWHAKLKAEENRVARMEEAALKLVTATANAFSCNDTTISSDTSDVEGRVELLAEKLAERRMEMVKLKKEARKQAKQRLKALEANLLNQITKYDTTINEMRKKLEQKRHSMKESDKLAIEAKSIADLKVPEIPIKRIEEIYRKNDLLRSCLETGSIGNNLINKSNSNHNDQSTSLHVSESDDQINHSIKRVLEKNRSSTSTTNSSKKVTKSTNSNDNEMDGKELSAPMMSSDSTERKSVSFDSNEISPKSNTSTSIYSQRTNNTLSDKKLLKHSLHQETSENNGSIFSSKINLLNLNNNNLSEDINTLENDLKTLSELVSRFSKKSEDKSQPISNQPDNELSTLKDITENISKSEVAQDETNDKSKEPEDVSDVLTIKSPTSNIQTAVESISDEASTILPSKSVESKLSTEIDFEAKSKEILNVVEKSIISEHSKFSGNNFEITGAALEQSMLNLHKDNEALSSDFNSLEGDIKSISEIISKMTSSKNLSIAFDNVSSSDTSHDSYSPQSFHVPNLDLKKLDQNSQTTTEIIDSSVNDSIKSQDGKLSEQEFDYTTETVEEVSDKITEYDENIDEEFENSNVNSNKFIEDVEDDKIMTDTENNYNKDTKNEISTSMHSKSNELSQPLQNNSREEEQDDDEGSKEFNDDGTISNSFKVVSRDIDSHQLSQSNETFEHEHEEKNVTDSYYQKDLTNDTNTEESLFIPTGESTNIHELQSQLKKTTTDSMQENDKSHGDELGDILDIIERDQNPEPFESVDILSKINSNDGKENNSFYNNEFNMTTDYEPVLQKITESLQSLEKNIENRTRDKELGKVDCVEEKDLNFSEELEKIDSKVKLNEYLDEALDLLNEDSEEPSRKQLDKNNDQFIMPEKLQSDKFNKIVSHTTQIRDPEYEDISEESLEVSEILDKSETFKSKPQKSNKMAERYEAVQQPDDVLRILDEITQKSLSSTIKEPVNRKPLNLTVQSPKYYSDDISDKNSEIKENTGVIIEEIDDIKSHLEINLKNLNESSKILCDKSDASNKVDEDGDLAETPREISELEMDSPKDQNESCLDIEVLNDNLLINDRNSSKLKELKSEIKSDGVLTTSEKDIEMMIDKLRASLNQPGLEVVDLNARLLRIEQLQIELQIKQLEAEEVSYYVREIPNKPPPPYTPPGIGSLSPESSPTLPLAIVPTNIDELTAFTEKATVIIFNAQQSGKDVMSLEVPPEINELNNDTNKVVKKDREVYNTFLFDLCKEAFAELYQSDYEKPGPSWTKPNVKTKPVIKIPKTIDELNEYVNKEVATLFGFKTKLQRENMVMRWSRKRRDRVDELLAREAQAEEDEWTKFHHDELAVKNELTVAILDTLIFETTYVVKTVYAKKRRIMF